MLRKFSQARQVSYDLPVTIKTKSGSKIFRCCNCSDGLSRALGLMGQTLAPGQGAFFDFEGMNEIVLWMKNCIQDLTAIFVDEEGKVVHIERMDCDKPTLLHRCPCLARYVVEISPNEVGSIAIGDIVE